MNKEKVFGFSIAFASALIMTSCGTTKQTVQTNSTETTSNATYDVHPVDVKSDVLTLSDGIRLFDDRTLESSLAAKYGYKKQNKYEAHNLCSYDVMLYKNSTLPKKMKDGSFMDLPKPLRNGTSSYIGLNQDKVEIGVFNDKAYNSLLNQVKQAGFKLAQDGYEQEYSNGVYSIFCYAPGKRIRIVKTL